MNDDAALARKLAGLNDLAGRFNVRQAGTHTLMTTELDDALEQVLARHIPHAIDRISARNDIVGLLVAAGVEIDQQVPTPKRSAPRRDIPLPE